MSTLGQRIEQGLHQCGLESPAGAVDKLVAYLALLEKWNAVYNLTALRDPESWVTHHVLDSLVTLPFLEGGPIADVGTGAGLPGIPLAIFRPDWTFTLIDSNQKKAAFLENTIGSLRLPNVRVRCERVEALGIESLHRHVISRAFAELAEFVSLAGRLLAPGGRMLAMKGQYPDEEIRRLPPTFRCDSVQQLNVPGLDAARHLVVLVPA
ncbi:MAG: 16S rRNA (guanine(527)-N(7))-methyltransferase RsmG [Betaproteobacteria bacterium]|nr:16S rRNA (guanine(527)-N(7))-methyltransferase RsmG [Betaproteobacteria bacterium]